MLSQATAPEAALTAADPTVVFIDWDDTILCSSYLTELNLSPFDDCEVPEDTQHMLDALEQMVVKILTLAMGGDADVRVFIVTNSERGWVEASAYHFLPDVYCMLDQVTIISARSMYEERYPGRSTAWKYCAFLAALHSTGFHKCHILSLGDSDDERLAALSLATGDHSGTLPEMVVKSVKLTPNGCPYTQCGQLDKVYHNLMYLMNEPRSFDLTIQ